jgi:hypothetical protein
MKVLTPNGPPTTGTSNRPRTVPLGDAAFRFLAVVATVQGAHMVEHVVQLLQVTVFGVLDDDALGLLGYVVQFNGTEEWLHLGYNAVFFVALWALVVPLRRVLPRRAFWTFAVACVWLETWHVVEHSVIISRVIANGGCPCPGIGDAALSISDTVLHFGYNAIATTGLAVTFVHVLRDRQRRLDGMTTDPVV